MAQNSLRFLKSATKPSEFPPQVVPEVAIVGRSNAGKSSLINAWFSGRHAKVSGAPGKTRLLNFFDVSNKYRLVDMPGYGYAARSTGEREAWRPMIETYLIDRVALSCLVLVADIRRKWSEEEEILKQMAAELHLPLLLVLNKEDKLKRNEVKKKKDGWHRDSGLEHVFVVSCLNKKGIEEFDEVLYQEFIEGFRVPKIQEESM